MKLTNEQLEQVLKEYDKSDLMKVLEGLKLSPESSESSEEYKEKIAKLEKSLEEAKKNAISEEDKKTLEDAKANEAKVSELTKKVEDLNMDEKQLEAFKNWTESQNKKPEEPVLSGNAQQAQRQLEQREENKKGE